MWRSATWSSGSFRITEYAEQLFEDIDKSWKAGRRKFGSCSAIGLGAAKALVDFKVEGQRPEKIRVFTTRIDTIFGATSVRCARAPVVADYRPL